MPRGLSGQQMWELSELVSFQVGIKVLGEQ